jgi:glyoxylase-like metal-dependent hydrolase (beta-lactamase superfamily II)
MSEPVRPADAPVAAVLEQVLGIVRALAAEAVGERAARAVQPLASLDRDVGLGSLERVELLLRLEEAFGRRLPESCLALDTAEALARAVLEDDGAGADAHERHRPDLPAASAMAAAGTLAESLWRRAQAEPGRPHVYLREDGAPARTLSYGELWAEAAAVAAGLRERGIAPGDVTHVFFSHHHPDHTMNAALFPEAEVVDFWARYKHDLWLGHDGDGWQMTEHAQLWLTPGHTEEDASLMVRADDALYALTHLWWRQDRTPEIDPYAPDQAVLETQRARVLAVADIVIPGHGEPFRVER